MPCTVRRSIVQVLVAVTTSLMVLAAGSHTQTASGAGADAWAARRVVEGTVAFPAEVRAETPFAAIDTSSGRVWLDLRTMAAPPQPMREGDRVVVDAYPTTRAGVLIPVTIRRAEASQPAAAPGMPRVAEPTPLAGSWNGVWVDPRDGRKRAAELIIVPGRQDATVVGQLTLLRGARTWSARYEGTTADGTARFVLPDGGALVVRRSGDDRLTGEFMWPGGPLPAPSGSLELSRVR